MPLTYQQAMVHVQRHTARHKLRFRNFAVSDFTDYKDDSRRWASGQDFRKVWALHEKWAGLCKTSGRRWGSANGKFFYENERARTFRFLPYGNVTHVPTLYQDRQAGIPAGTERVVLSGVGQCEYFAAQAFSALSKRGRQGTVPRIDKISTYMHNWVLVNSDAPNQDDWIAVDYWMYALGAPERLCICRYKGFEYEQDRPVNGVVRGITWVNQFGPM
ncbi:MAG: hypothetical protein AAFU85_02235 [Planctomycetota bacterium]